MSMCPKSTILVVMMFAHFVPVIEMDYDTSDWGLWASYDYNISSIEGIPDWGPETSTMRESIPDWGPETSNMRRSMLDCFQPTATMRESIPDWCPQIATIRSVGMGPGIPRNREPNPATERTFYTGFDEIRPVKSRPVSYRPFDYQAPSLYDCKSNSSGYDDLTDESARRCREISEEGELLLTGPVSTVLIPSFYTLVFIISVPLNICGVLVFMRKVKPRNPASIFMLNLACADLLFAAVLPFKIAYHFNGNNWIFGPVMCRLVSAAFYWNMYCSVLLIASMSMDRFLTVVYTFRSLTWRSLRKAVIVCVAMWVLSSSGSMYILFTEQTVRLNQLNITTCHDVQASELFPFYKLYFIILCCLLYFLPLIITLVSYTGVIKTLSKVKPGLPDRDHKKRRAVMLASTVLVMFVVCFTPTNCLFIVHVLMYDEGDVMNKNNADGLYMVYLVFQCLGSLNCLLDPLVYYYGSTYFKKELSSLLGRKKTTQSSSGPSASTNQTALKSNHKNGSKTNTPLVNSDSSHANLCSQCKKNLV